MGLKRLGEKRLKRWVEKGRRERGNGGRRAGRGRMRRDVYRVYTGAFVWRGEGEGDFLWSGLGGGPWFDRTGLGSLLGRARWGMGLFLVVVFFVILEGTSAKIGGSFGVPITLELDKSAGRKRGEGRGTYAHSTFDDGDDIVRAILVETGAALFVVEDDDGDVYGAEDTKLISFFEEAVLPLERKRVRRKYIRADGWERPLGR